MKRTNCTRFFVTALTIGVCYCSFLFYRALSSKMRLVRMKRANCKRFFIIALTIGVCYCSFLFEELRVARCHRFDHWCLLLFFSF